MAISIEDNDRAEFATFGERTPYETVCIALYELGAVARNIVHAESQVDPAIARAQYADAIAELSDLVTQVGLLYQRIRRKVSPASQELYSSFCELIQLGRERQIERVSEWRERRAIKETAPDGFFRTMS